MKKQLFLSVALLWCTLVTLGQTTFTAGGINYNITSSTTPFTVAVAAHSTTFTGGATIPATVTNSSITYSVTSIGIGAFNGCSGLTLVSIPSSVTSINDSAFNGCTGLSSISIPSSVTSIGTNAFRNCTGLTSVSIPSSVISISSSAFRTCTRLTSVSIPSSVTAIGTSAFQGCTGLTSVSIPSSLTSIPSFAFRGCIGLTSVSIPSSVISIGGSAFNGCTGLTSVTVNWATPIIITADVFQDITLANVVLNVPTGTAALYEAAAVWTDFNLSVALSNNTLNKTANINLYPNPSTGIFNLQLINDLQVEVYNYIGQLLSSKKMISGDNVIDVSDKAAGIYFLKAIDGNNVRTYKIIKN